MQLDNLVLKFSILPTKLIGFNIQLNDVKERFGSIHLPPIIWAMFNSDHEVYV